MLISSILSQARKNASDTDTSDPFHTDADIYEFVSDWLQEVAMEYGYPRKQQAITFAADAGGASGTKNLDNDMLEIVLVVYEPTGGTFFHLSPRTEAEMAAADANWRSAASGTPSYYIIQDAITAQANALGPARTITTDRPVSVGGTMRIYGLQIPATISAGTSSPVYSAAFHKSAVYYCTAHMLMPRDLKAGDYYLGLYQRKLRRCKTLLQEHGSPGTQIWDRYEGAGGFTADRLSRYY